MVGAKLVLIGIDDHLTIRGFQDAVINFASEVLASVSSNSLRGMGWPVAIV